MHLQHRLLVAHIGVGIGRAGEQLLPQQNILWEEVVHPAAQIFSVTYNYFK